MIKRYTDIVCKLYVLIRTYPIENTYENLHISLLDMPQVEVIELFSNFYNIKNFS